MITLKPKSPLATPLDRQVWACSECGREFRATSLVFGRGTHRGQVNRMRSVFESHLVKEHGYEYQNVGLGKTRALPPLNKKD